MKKIALLISCAVVLAAGTLLGAETAGKEFFTRWSELSGHEMLRLFDSIDRAVDGEFERGASKPFAGKSAEEVVAAIDAACKAGAARTDEDLAKAYGKVEEHLNLDELRQVFSKLAEEEDFNEALRKGYLIFGKEVAAKMNLAQMPEVLALDREKLPEAMAVLVSVPTGGGEAWRTEAHPLAENLAYAKAHYADNLAKNLALQGKLPAGRRDKVIDHFLAKVRNQLAEDSEYTPLAEYEKLNSELVWLTDFAAAQARAKAENKPLFVLFTGSDWCPYCMMLEKEILSTPEFKDYASRNLVPVMVDFPRASIISQKQRAANEELGERYGVRGYPTIIIMTPDGEAIDEMGYERVSPGEYIQEIEAIVGRM